MMLLLYLPALLLGLIIGSFLTALTYRIPNGESIFKGRSKCDKCSGLIYWYDNIPVVSYIILGGKCRHCGRHISIRYPLIEIFTSLVFAGIFNLYLTGSLNLPLMILELIISSVLVAVLIFDIEYQIIPDQAVFAVIGMEFMRILIYSPENIYSNFLTGFSLALFLLILHLITRGRGMGLGDVKLAVFMGLTLGYPDSVTWMFMSFLIGAIAGVVLILTGKTKFGKQIAFGPFLVVCYFLMLFWGKQLTGLFVPFLN